MRRYWDRAPRDPRDARYQFPYGDFDYVHRCGVIAAEVRAARLHCTDIEVAADHLHDMLDNQE
jgi:hypothetical protein